MPQAWEHSASLGAGQGPQGLDLHRSTWLQVFQHTTAEDIGREYSISH